MVCDGIYIVLTLPALAGYATKLYLYCNNVLDKDYLVSESNVRLKGDRVKV